MENKNRKLKHGLSNHKLYNLWQGIKTRCYNSNSNRYKYYGEKGIKVCNKWMIFMNFYIWAMTNGYQEGLTIDRLNRNKNYEPSNCEWVDYKKQNNHKLNAKRLLYKSKKYTIKEAEMISKVPATTIYQRLRKGMNHRDIIETPPQTVNQFSE